MNAREMIAEIQGAGDGCESAESLASWMVDAFAGTCDTCRAETAHNLACDLLPLVRPDFFTRWDAKSQSTPAKSTEEQAENASTQMEEALTTLYYSESIKDAREKMAYFLTLSFGDEHEAAAVVVADRLTTRILRGMAIECVGSVPGDAIRRAGLEFSVNHRECV